MNDDEYKSLLASLPHNPVIFVGCVGCPFAGNQKKILERFPKYKQNYILAFDRMLKTTNKKLGTWHTGEDVYKWWIQDDEIPGQMDLNQFLNNQVDSGGK